MKKVFAILAVVAFVACNTGANNETPKDSTATPAPTETPTGDSSTKATGDSSTKVAGDSSKKID